MLREQTVVAQMARVKTRGSVGASEALAEEIVATLGEDWLPRIYRERIMPLRTRAYQLPQAQGAAEVSVQHTLLGVELKIGRKRLSCPDLATARYLSVFARLGCAAVAVP